jgi:formamidopyrimidine-DNA glycosylase
MFELPEVTNLKKQINQTILGLAVQHAKLGNTPHKFVWYNRAPDEFEALMSGKRLGEAYCRGRWLFIPVEPGYVLVFGEFGGKLLYHAPGAKEPPKYHLCLRFENGSLLSAMTQMWGAYELYEKGQELERQYIKNMRPVPLEPEFSYAYFERLIEDLLQGEKRSVKGLLTQDQLIPGLGNSAAQDILFHARLHPRHPISELDAVQRRKLYNAILSTVCAIIDQGGRYDELDLFNHPGGYTRLMDSKTEGQPCPACGAAIQKIQYLGGACYFCPACQT